MTLRQKILNNFFFLINKLTARIASIEKALYKLEERFERELTIQRQHLIRLKNGQKLSDDFILAGRTYNDLSPEEAWKLYQDPNFDFILLDVSHKLYHPEFPRPQEAIHIPLEDLENRFQEIKNKRTPLLIISEDGLRSILACEYLVQKGYFNCNNISGGYKFWPGFRLLAQKTYLDSSNSIKSESA